MVVICSYAGIVDEHATHSKVLAADYRGQGNTRYVFQRYCQIVYQRVVAIYNHGNKAWECCFLQTSPAPAIAKLKQLCYTDG